MKNIIILVFLCLFAACEPVKNNKVSTLLILREWVEEIDGGVYVKLKVKNLSDKPAKYIGYNIQSLDATNTILASGIGTATNIQPQQSAIIDRYFPAGQWAGKYEYKLDEASY